MTNETLVERLREEGNLRMELAASLSPSPALAYKHLGTDLLNAADEILRQNTTIAALNQLHSDTLTAQLVADRECVRLTAELAACREAAIEECAKVCARHATVHYRTAEAERAAGRPTFEQDNNMRGDSATDCKNAVLALKGQK